MSIFLNFKIYKKNHITKFMMKHVSTHFSSQGHWRLAVVPWNRVARFFLKQYTKMGKFYWIAKTYTKLPLNKANDHKVYQMILKDIEIFLLMWLPKSTEKWGVGLKAKHLATLHWNQLCM
jgi:hypothetical protein